MKVFELAKKLGKSSKEILQAADYLEILIKSHLSSLSEEEVKQIIKYFRKRRFLFFYKKYFSLFLLIFLITVLFSILNPQSVLSGELDASVNELGELTLDWEFDDSVESAILLIETDSELFLIEVFESGGNTIECCYDENLAVTLFLTDNEGNEEELETKNIEVSNNISTTSTSSTTSTTLSTSTTSTTTTLPECNDEDFKPYTLYDSEGNANTVLTCRNEQDALDSGFIYTINPKPITSSPTTTTTTTQPTTTTTTTQPTTTTTLFNLLPDSEEILSKEFKCELGIKNKSGEELYYFQFNTVIGSDNRDLKYRLSYSINGKDFKNSKLKKFPKNQTKNLTLKYRRFFSGKKWQINTFEYSYKYKYPDGTNGETSYYTVDEKLPCGFNGQVSTTTTTSIPIGDRNLGITNDTDVSTAGTTSTSSTTTSTSSTTTSTSSTTTSTSSTTTSTSSTTTSTSSTIPEPTYIVYDRDCNEFGPYPIGEYNAMIGDGSVYLGYCIIDVYATSTTTTTTTTIPEPPASSPTTTTSTTTTTLPSSINMTTGETYSGTCYHGGSPAGTREYGTYFTNNESESIYILHENSMGVAATQLTAGETRNFSTYIATHGANSRQYKVAFTEAGLNDTEFITRNFNLNCEPDIDITQSLASCAGSKGSRTRISSLSFTNNDSETAYVHSKYSLDGGSTWEASYVSAIFAGQTVSVVNATVPNGGSILWKSHKGFSTHNLANNDYYTENTSNTIDCPDGYYVNVDGSNTYALTLDCKKWNSNTRSLFRGNPWWGSQSTARSYMFALIALTGDYDDGDSDVEVTDYFNYPDSGNCFGIINEAWFPWKRQNDAYVGWSFYAPEWNSENSNASWESDDYENFVFAELVP